MSSHTSGAAVQLWDLGMLCGQDGYMRFGAKARFYFYTAHTDEVPHLRRFAACVG